MIDDLNREEMAIDVGLLLPAARVIRPLNQTIEWLSKLAKIRSENGLGSISYLLPSWAKENETELLFISPSNPK